MTATDTATLVQLAYNGGDRRYLYTLKLNRAAHFNVHARRDELAKLSGFDLEHALEDCGALLNDAPGRQGQCMPAIQAFDAQTGMRIWLNYFTNGKPQDPASGEPARQDFDAQTGLVTAAYSSTKARNLSEAELRALNQQRGPTPPLPAFLKPIGPAPGPA